MNTSLFNSNSVTIIRTNVSANLEKILTSAKNLDYKGIETAFWGTVNLVLLDAYEALKGDKYTTKDIMTASDEVEKKSYSRAMDKTTAVTNLLNHYACDHGVHPAVKKLSVNPPSEMTKLQHDMNNYRNLNIALNE